MTRCTVFSAVDAQQRRSSMVAMSVRIFPSSLISVITWRFRRSVITVNPAGTLKLSGATASAIAAAVFASSYSSVIVASNLLALQLLSD